MKSTIVKVVKELDNNKIPYFLTGGVVLYLKGIVKKTKDIDVFVNLKDFKKLKKIYSKNIITIPENPKTYLNIIINKQEIEFVGTTLNTDRYANTILKKKNYDTIKINKQKVNISTIENLLLTYKKVYKKRRKEKHLKRIKLLENWISNNKK